MSRQDLGAGSATGLIERTGAPPADGGGPAPTSSMKDVTAARPATWFDRIRVTLGIAEKGGPKGLNWQVLRQPGFSWYFVGSVVSNFGTWLQNTAQVVLAYQLTHSVFWVGLVTCAQFTSPLVLGAWAGVLTHKFGNWRTLIITQCASMVIALTLAVLDFDGMLTRNWLIAGALLIGLFFTFALPALSVTVATLVPPAETKRALAMDSVSYNLGRALAPVCAVLVFSRFGFGWAFALNAISYGYFTVVLLCLCPRENLAESAQSRGGHRHRFLAALRWLFPRQASTEGNRSRVGNGFRIALEDRRIMILLLMVAAVTVAADPILVLGPALARSFGASADYSGLFITALGAGNVIGSFRPSRQAPSIRRGATMLAILSLTMIVFVLAPWIGISIAAAFAAGAACLIAGATTRALLLHRAGPECQAAVMAAWAVAWAGSKPLASFADGTLASHIGLQATGVLLALPALVPAVALLLRLAAESTSSARSSSARPVI